MQLDASESMNNMGNLRVDVLDAFDLPAADRNGKSDPYCKFELNGQEIYKTKVIKKTLNPTWNEFFEVPVPSRTAAKFKVNVWDYDFADKPDLLGVAEIPLDGLDPFRPSESKHALDGKSGTVRIRLLFRPDYVTRTRQGTSTFGGTFSSAPGRIVTGVAGVPLKGGVAVAGAVGHGVGKSASFVRRGLFRKKDTNDIAEEDVPEVIEPPASTPNGGLRRASQAIEEPEVPMGRPSTSNGNGNGFGHSRTKSTGQASIHSTLPGGGPNGTASFTVLGATGFPPASDLYVLITQISPKEKIVGKTKHYKSGMGQWTFDETFKFPCTPEAQFKIEAKGEHLFGSDDDLGEHIYFVDESGVAASKDLSVGSGTVTIKSSFQPAESSLSPESPKAHIRSRFLSKREARSSRETTPNP